LQARWVSRRRCEALPEHIVLRLRLDNPQSRERTSRHGTRMSARVGPGYRRPTSRSLHNREYRPATCD
jgi:hypothetical protein